MAEERQSPAAVAELSATEVYTTKREAWQAEESRLAALQRRQAGGERLSREELLDKLTLAEDIEQLRHEAEAAKPAMEAEQLERHIAAVVDEWNRWIPLQVQAFDEFVRAIRAVYAARDTLVKVHTTHGSAIADTAPSTLPGFDVPDGAAAFQNIVSCLPNAGGWQQALRLDTEGVSGHDENAMRANHTAAIPKDVTHVRDAVQRRRREVYGSG